jgi:hypothetical protein
MWATHEATTNPFNANQPVMTCGRSAVKGPFIISDDGAGDPAVNARKRHEPLTAAN